GRAVPAARRSGGGAVTAPGSWVISGARPLGGDPADVLISGGIVAGTGRDAVAEDAEPIGSGRPPAALARFPSVHAMANTEPVADTAGVVEQICRLGRQAGHCDVQPVGAGTVGLGGRP